MCCTVVVQSKTVAIQEKGGVLAELDTVAVQTEKNARIIGAGLLSCASKSRSTEPNPASTKAASYIPCVIGAACTTRGPVVA